MNIENKNPRRKGFNFEINIDFEDKIEKEASMNLIREVILAYLDKKLWDMCGELFMDFDPNLIIKSKIKK